MHITGSKHRLVQLLSQFDNLPVQILQIFFRLDVFSVFLTDHKCIIADWLNLQIIIKVRNTNNFLFCFSFQNCLEQFSRFTGRSQNQSLPVLLYGTLRDTGSSVVILQMRPGYQTVQIDSSNLILCQNNGMIGRKLLDLFQRSASQLIDAVQVKDILFCQHLYKFQKNLCCTFRIVHCTVMVVQINMQRLCNRIQLKTVQLWQHNTCQCYSIQIRKGLFPFLSAAVLFNKTDIKSCIMSHQYRISHKFQKLWQDLFNHRRIHHHVIIDAGQFFNSKRNRHLWIDKGRKTVCDFSVFHFNRADLDDPVIHRTKAGSLQVKHHKAALQILPLRVYNNILGIIHQISFHSINHLKWIVNQFQFFLGHIRMFCLIFIPVCPVNILDKMIGIRERLQRPVIGNSDS